MPRSIRLPLVCAASVLALVAIPQALAGTNYADPAGDSGAAPDITQVVVSDAVGLVSFRVACPLAPNSEAAIRIDANSDGQADFMLVDGVEADGSKYYSVYKWGGSKFEYQPSIDAVAITVPGGFEIAVAKTALGLSGSFAFALDVVQYVADAAVGSDFAPDGALPWTYTFTTAPVAPKVVTAVISAPVVSPSRPEAGKRLTIVFAVMGSDTAASLTTGTATAVASIGGKSTPVRVSFSGGSARVVLTPPKDAKGKLLVLRLAVVVGGKTTTRQFVAAIS